MTVTISASLNGSTAQTTLRVDPFGVKRVNLNPPGIVGGNTGTLNTVTLNESAPAGGIHVTLASSNTSLATVPATVFVPGGSFTSQTFTITTYGLGGLQQRVNITASYGGTSAVGVLTVHPANLASLTLHPASIPAGSASTGTVQLTGAAPPTGLAISLTSAHSGVSVPASVTVAAGAKSASFPINTTAASSGQAVSISARNGGTTVSASLTVN